jgi:hypothetical protein
MRAKDARSAGLAQMVEQLICNQWVGSSSLSAGASFPHSIGHILDGAVNAVENAARC